ncbi:hypothetical protein Y032_0016g3016 [Ancylostoma ceylanicum]|uniref:Uncharacterized protein n=1 Tax=Ancylostoma ceylanicum TaxID=53326 RepID=A0A016V6L1_9BILA|nr:hypothetical protein Y032_0016g3016 [Ancylostoma ceylanicum]
MCRKGRGKGAGQIRAPTLSVASRTYPSMRLVAVGLLFSLMITALASPIHGIWNHLPQNPSKRYYGLYQHLPAVDDRDKRIPLYYWAPADE